MGGPDTTGVVRGGGLVLHGALSLQTPVYIYIYIWAGNGPPPALSVEQAQRITIKRLA